MKASDQGKEREMTGVSWRGKGKRQEHKVRRLMSEEGAGEKGAKVEWKVRTSAG